MPHTKHDASIVATQQKLRAVFMGTPGFASIILEHLLKDTTVEIVALYCQPDRPAGRGKNLKMPETKTLALAHNIPIEQPLSFKNADTIQTLKKYTPDVLLVAAYGLILPQAVLDIPKLLPINVHASLLPRYRGAAPIQRAIINGDAVTGITIMKMEAGLDTGPILSQRAVGIDINDTSATLHDELAHEGAILLVESLKRLQEGTLKIISQDNGKASHAAKLSKAEARITMNVPCTTLHACIRGLAPWPGASLTILRPGLEPLTVQVAPGLFPLPKEVQDMYLHAPKKTPGTILGTYEDALVVTCKNGCYAFPSLRPAGKKVMSGKAFYNGYLGTTPAHVLLPETE